MFKKKTQIKNRPIHKQVRDAYVNLVGFGGMIIAFIAIAFCVLPSCISPEAFQTEIQGIRLEMEGIEKVADELSVWKKNVQAETINYGGAGWVVVGTGVMALILVGGGLLLVRAFSSRGSMLTLLTKAIKNAGEDSPDVVVQIKRQLKRCASEADSIREIDQAILDRKNLGQFCKKKGHFAEQKSEFEV